MPSDPIRRRTVLVTDAERGAALAIVRSLGRGGHRVVTTSPSERCLGARSRYSNAHAVLPDPRFRANEFVDRLLDLVEEHGVDLVIPVLDRSVHPLAAARARFQDRCILAVPEAEALRAVTDKHATLLLAEELGIAVPRGFLVPASERSGIEEAARELGWPVVVKPCVSETYDPEHGTSRKARVSYAAHAEELAHRLDDAEGSVLVQEFVPGKGVGVELLCENGQARAAFQHVRLAEVPVTGGASAWREGAELEPELLQTSLALARALRWTGLMMVEFKCTADRSVLMEVNGRPWGSLPLACASGMDFPLRWANLLLDHTSENLDPTLDTDYRIGRRTYNPELMLPWFVNVLLGRRRVADVPTPSRSALIPAFLALLDPRQRSDHFAWDDLRPVGTSLALVLSKLGRKGLSRSAGND